MSRNHHGVVVTDIVARVVPQRLERLGVSAEQDRAAIGVALSGTLGRSSDPKLVPEVNEAMAVAASSSRDSLIEGLGRMPIDAAGALLDELEARGLLAR